MLLLLEDELPDAWRVQIIDALGWSEYMAAIDTLDKASNNPDPEIRCAVMRASARLGHPAAMRWIMMGLADPVPSVRLQAIAASARMGLRKAVPAIAQLRHDPELWVRLRAEQALEQLAPVDDVAQQAVPVA